MQGAPALHPLIRSLLPLPPSCLTPPLASLPPAPLKGPTDLVSLTMRNVDVKTPAGIAAEFGELERRASSLGGRAGRGLGPASWGRELSVRAAALAMRQAWLGRVRVTHFVRGCREQAQVAVQLGMGSAAEHVAAQWAPADLAAWPMPPPTV